MGLDMYLRAGKYVSGFKHCDEPEKTQYAQILALIGLTPGLCDGSPSLTVNVTVAYWRKANAIHRWFVDSVQDGKDECQDSYVSREQLTELRSLCQRVLENTALAGELLPPQKGFFFGSTDIDEYYKSDLESTVRQLTRILDSEELKGFDFEYRSSW